MKNVLLIGFKASVPGPASPQQVTDGLNEAKANVEARGHTMDLCLIDDDAAELPAVELALGAKRYDVVVLGGGLRLPPQHTELFEKLVNLVHTRAPGVKFAFSTSPAAGADAALRWL